MNPDSDRPPQPPPPALAQGPLAGRRMLTPWQFAHQMGVSRSSVYRWIDEGAIPADCVCYQGFRRILIASDAIPRCISLWRSARGL